MRDAISLLKEQQAKVAEGSAPWTVAEQLMDICRREPESAALIAQDLEQPGMGIVEAEMKIKARADAKHRKNGGGSACVTPREAEEILREFYGLPGASASAEALIPGSAGVLLNFADFLR